MQRLAMVPAWIASGADPRGSAVPGRNLRELMPKPKLVSRSLIWVLLPAHVLCAKANR